MPMHGGRHQHSNKSCASTMCDKVSECRKLDYETGRFLLCTLYSCSGCTQLISSKGHWHNTFGRNVFLARKACRPRETYGSQS